MFWLFAKNERGIFLTAKNQPPCPSKLSAETASRKNQAALYFEEANRLALDISEISAQLLASKLVLRRR
jgi:hypothetical protein